MLFQLLARSVFLLFSVATTTGPFAKDMIFLRDRVTLRPLQPCAIAFQTLGVSRLNHIAEAVYEYHNESSIRRVFIAIRVKFTQLFHPASRI